MASVSGATPGDRQKASRRVPRWQQVFQDLTGIDISLLPGDHPLYITLRTYVLFLALALGPKLLPILIRSASGRKDARLHTPIGTIIRRAFGRNALAFAMTTAVGGGAFLDASLSQRANRDALQVGYKDSEDGPSRSSLRRTFMANAATSLFAITLLHARSKRKISAQRKQRSNTKGEYSTLVTTHTLDFTLVMVVRAFDALWRAIFLHKQHTTDVAKGKQRQDDSNTYGEKTKKKLEDVSSIVDAFLFMLAGGRIMWCFFYKPHRLPNSYVKWIGRMANVDNRLIQALRYRREGKWTYGENTPTKHLMVPMATELGYPASWGDPSCLPPHGGPAANRTWKELGVTERDGLGGMPCEMIHGRLNKNWEPVGGSCFRNAAFRGAIGFSEALLLYTPVHALSVLFSNPKSLLSSAVLQKLAFSIARSSLFLSTFISSTWFGVCVFRTLVVARLLPFISHNFYDGPYGCTFAGSLVCGSSIWIEHGRRRGEIALYVLPKAIRSFFKRSWLYRMPKCFMLLERVIFALSLSTILTTSKHYPESLRGLSRWTLLFILKGPSFQR